MASKAELFIDYAEHEYRSTRGLVGLSLGPLIYIVAQLGKLADYSDAACLFIGFSFGAFLVNAIIGAVILLSTRDAISQMKRTIADNPQDPSSDITFRDVKRYWNWESDRNGKQFILLYWSLVAAYSFAAASVGVLFMERYFQAV